MAKKKQLTEETIRGEVQALRAALNDAVHEQGSSSFSPAAEIFMDLTERPGFVELGFVHHDETLTKIIGRLAVTMARGKVPELRELRLFRLPTYGFVHGGCFMNGGFAGMFWFEAENQGLVVIPHMNGTIDMLRITAIDPPPGTPPLSGGPVGSA